MSSQGLRQYADDPEFQQKWADVKGIAKAKALAHIREITGVQISDHVMLDIQARHATTLLSHRAMVSLCAAPDIAEGAWALRQIERICAGEEDTRVQEAASQCARHHLALRPDQKDDA